MNITRGRLHGAKKIVIYGPEGIGKSTFAASFPNPVFIDTEDSTKDMDVSRFDKASSWPLLLEQVRYVISNPDICGTLVLDTADWAEQIEIADLLASNQKNGIEDFGYGKGYTYSAERFGELLNLLTEVTQKGIHVVVTAHAQLRKVELPEELGAYDHWEMKTSKKVAPMIREWADAVFFANYKVNVINIDNQGAAKGKNKAQGGKRVIHTNHTPFWDAKNRYGLPDELPLTYDSIRHIIEDTGAASKQQKPEKPAKKAVSAASKREEPRKEPEPAEVTRPALPDPEAVEQMTIPDAVLNPDSLDKRIPKKLRDLMIASNLDEWNLQNVINARIPGAFPPDMQVKDYPQDFLDEWVYPNWGQIVDYAKKLTDKEEIPFN